MKYFQLSEFDSSDAPGSGSNMDPYFLQLLDIIRGEANIPFRVNSGYRTEAHNADPKVGGKKNSAHRLGKAVDIQADSGYEKFAIVSAAIKHGIKRIGIGKDFIHLDNAITDLPWPTIWLY